jgi:hypothetical protein
MCGPRKDAQRVKRKFGEESVKQHHTQMRKQPSISRRWQLSKSDVTRRLGLRPRFPGFRVPRFCGKVGDKCGPPASERGELSDLAACRIFRLRMVWVSWLAWRPVFPLIRLMHSISDHRRDPRWWCGWGFSLGDKGYVTGKFTTSQFSTVSPANPEDGELRQVQEPLV